MFETKFEDGTEITNYLATAYAEGFCEGENASAEDQLRAWSYLIKTGMAWLLQGCFGRTAATLIEQGYISREGVINWDVVAE
jgi:hypothetical protein